MKRTIRIDGSLRLEKKVELSARNTDLMMIKQENVVLN